jgi:hypothetical protein
MSALAILENALWSGEYSSLADSHSHRAIREDSISISKGRDAILAKWVEVGDLAANVAIDLEDMVAVQGANNEWQLHRWVWREDGRILREVEVTNRQRDLVAPSVHPPIGELRAGLGQYAATAEPELPPQFPEEARGFAQTLHSAWNGRAFAGEVPEAIRSLIQDMPDATFYFEHAIVRDGTTAVLFRVAAHHHSGRRVRLFGSHLVNKDEDAETVVDWSAYVAQQTEGHIQYGLE